MRICRILSLVLAVVLFLLTFAGCQKPADTSELVEGPKLADLKDTDTLVLYIRKEHETLEQRRINQFTVAYGINVEVVRVEGDEDEYTERVMNDLASGSGPDVLFLNELDLDVTKAALSHNFLDLTNILSEDPDFSKDDYIDGVFESCQFNGRQYIVPLSYESLLTISSAEKLEELGFEWDGINTTADFMEEIARLTPDFTEAPGFAQMLDTKNAFHKVFRASGVPLLDYENKEVLPDEKSLREFLEAYKSYFPYDYDETGIIWTYSRGDGALMAGTCAFWSAPSMDGVTTTLNIMKNKSYVYVVQAIPSQEEKIVGSAFGQMAISANAKNSMNAYKFIKFMLSGEAQKDNFISLGYMPILKEAIHEGIHDAHALKYINNVLVDDDKLAFSKEEAENLVATIMGVEQFVRRVPQVLSYMLFESMLPFFRDEASYKDCLKDLKNKLTLYLSE